MALKPSGAGAREPLHRAAPVTLEDHLSMAYAARFRLEGVDSEAVEDCATRLRAAGMSKARLVQERNRLADAEMRCHVTRTNREFLDSVIAGMG